MLDGIMDWLTGNWLELLFVTIVLVVIVVAFLLWWNTPNQKKHRRRKLESQLKGAESVVTKYENDQPVIEQKKAELDRDRAILEDIYRSQNVQILKDRIAEAESVLKDGRDDYEFNRKLVEKTQKQLRKLGSPIIMHKPSVEPMEISEVDEAKPLVDSSIYEDDARIIDGLDAVDDALRLDSDDVPVMPPPRIVEPPRPSPMNFARPGPGPQNVAGSHSAEVRQDGAS